MSKKETDELARRGRSVYEQQLKAKLEPAHHGEFVAIELTSGDYFLASGFSEALQAARRVYPDRLAYVHRVGYETAVHIGAM